MKATCFNTSLEILKQLKMKKVPDYHTLQQLDFQVSLWLLSWPYGGGRIIAGIGYGAYWPPGAAVIMWVYSETVKKSMSWDAPMDAL